MLSFTHHHRSNFRFLVAALLAASMFVLLASPSAMAACNKFGRGKDCAQPTPTPPGFTEAYLYSSNFDSGENPLFCESGPGNTTANGDYSCAGTLPEVYLSTLALTGIFSQKNWDLCHALNPGDGRTGVFLTPDAMSFGWTDSCSDDGLCATEFRMSFSGVDVEAETNGKADELNVILYATIAPTSVVDDPFQLPIEKQTMVFDRVQLDFVRSSTGRAVGSCMWYTDTLNFSGNQAQAKAISFPGN